MITGENRTELKTKGYTVVPGVISPSNCDKYVKEYQQWLLQFGKKWPKSHSSLINGYNTGHLDTTWHIRLESKDVFSQIWGTDKLLASFDAIAIGRPPESGKEKFDSSNYWLHLDQESTRVGLHAYQGGVYLEEAALDDWTLQVMENSHNVFEKFFSEDRQAAERSDKEKFFELTKTQIKYFEDNGCKIKRIPVPKGGLVLWDSRLVHANAAPLEGRANPGRWRYVVFVSMTPALWASAQDLALKQDAFQNTRMTNHWSSNGSVLIEEPASSKAFPKKAPELASCLHVQQLAGVKSYNFKDGKPNGPTKPCTKTQET